MFGMTKFLKGQIDAHKSLWKLVKAGVLIAGSYFVTGFLGSPEAGITFGAVVTGFWNWLKHNILKE